MKTQENRTFKYGGLKEVMNEAKKRGYKVYTFESSSKYIEQIFIENKKGQIGTCSDYFGGFRFSTMHKSKYGSGLGTGFGNLIKGQDFDTIEDMDACFRTYPYWTNKGDVYKYTSFSDYLEKGLGILTYYEL